MPSSLIHLLEPVIGQTLQLKGYTGRVIDVLNDPPALVLQDDTAETHIHCDYLGRPQENAVPRWTLSLLSDTGNALHPDLQRQLDPKLARALQQHLFKPD
ncbi:MAG: hypothetical protein ACYC3A_07725 [Halothiobacillus sp.]